jgi:predicted O-methyltransferase YrrM
MKIDTLFWLAKRPEYWRQGFEIVKRRLLYRNDEYGKEEAAEWCKENAFSEVEALQTITGKPAEAFKPVSLILKDEYDKALFLQDNCPVEMGGPGALNFLYHIVKHFNPSKLIETGVAYGWSSWTILQAIKCNNARLISIDMPYINMENDKYVGCCVSEQLRDQWTLLRKADRQGIPAALSQFNQTIDFCHYDSDKSYSGRMWAYQLLWSHLGAGRIFISDDIQDNIAFKEFCESIQQEPIVIESKGKYVGMLMKK